MKSKKANKGIPHGAMSVPAPLVNAFKQQAAFESKLMISREDIKKATAKFYTTFKAKFPKAGLADFARQFSKDVPFDRAEYKSNATYLALDNMFRYMPEVKTGGKPESAEAKARRIEQQKRETKKRKAQAVALRTRSERLLIAICNQIGVPHDLFAIAAQRVGFSPSEIEVLYNVKGSLVDVGLGTYQLAVRATGVSALKAAAQRKVTTAQTVASIPSPAELANAAKSKPQVTSTPTPSVNTPEGMKRKALISEIPSITYKGKGQYQRTIKPADNLSTAPR